jgi:serine/threonine-protein kinase
MLDQNIAHYKITTKLGQGGMGEVYRATDTKLDREVAIKVLPESFAQDKERLARFEREAKTLATLNHPNIAGIYGLERTGNSQALILELVEGEDLSQRLKRGALPLEEALDVCHQTAQALEAAHEKGVIHRDLKPANIKLSHDGKVKALDFGLAKSLVSEPSTADEESPTITADHTLPGTLLGTAGYMSPEQAKGKAVDKRSDIWSFGIVLYECLTGTRLFKGETVTDSIGALLHKEPDWTVLPPNTPPSIQHLLRKCLRKDRKKRLHDIADARIELEEALAEPDTAFFPQENTEDLHATAGKMGGKQVAFIALVACVVTAGLMWAFQPKSSPSLMEPRYADLHFPGELGFTGSFDSVELLPNGKEMIYNLSDMGSGPLLTRSLIRDQSDTAIPETEGAVCMFVSPKGDWIGYNTFKPASLKKTPLKGGRTVELNDLKDIPPFRMLGGTWSESGMIVLAVNRDGIGLEGIPEQGGELVPLTKLSHADEVHSWPRAVPGGKYILYGSHSETSNPNGTINMVEMDGNNPVIVHTPKGTLTRATYLKYLNNDYLLFHQQGNLFAISFDLENLKTQGNEVMVQSNVWGRNGRRSAQFEVSSHGDLVYLPDPGEQQSQAGLFWLTEENELKPATSIKGDWQFANWKISGDGKRVALEQDGDLYIVHLDTAQLPERLTHDGNSKSYVLWSTGDEWLHYLIKEERSQSIYRIKTDLSSDQPELIYRNDTNDFTLDEITSFTPEPGGYIVTVHSQDSKNDIQKLVLVDGTYQLEHLLSSSDDMGAGVVSPDGQWLAYQRAVKIGTQRERQVYVKPYRQSAPSIKIPIDSGVNPSWSNDGKYLFVENLEEGIYRIEIQSNDGKITMPQPSHIQNIFDMPPGFHFGQIQITPQGDKAMIMGRAGDETRGAGTQPTLLKWQTLKVVFNWTTHLNQLMGASN